MYYTRKGVKYYWNIVTSDLTEKDRKTAFEVLNEIIKRVDKNKVEIIDRRKKR